ncbi:DNA-directed DNA polymerase II small subunit [Candidatus Woesearchaeota archaeon]|nr:DNA-directed DNA polymerase II small subunit [Candidatus Woesearchaeota archaeon]
MGGGTDVKASIGELLKQNILISPDFLSSMEAESVEGLKGAASEASGLLVLNKEVNDLIKKGEFGVNWLELERSKTLSEKRKKPEAYELFLEALSLQKPFINDGVTAQVKTVFSYNASPGKRDVADFVSYYLARYKAIQGVLLQRPELANLVQVARLKSGSFSESLAVIGMVKDKQETKKGNLVISVEDPTGEINVIVSRSKREVFERARDLVFDEVIGVAGNFRSGAVFATNIVLPEIPFREPKHSPEEGCAVFMSDLHFGSAQFLEEDFRRFLKWINGGLGNQSQRELAAKVKYVLVAGDVVDGVGVYQDQHDELAIKDVIGQYKMCADFLSEIPRHIKIIVSPGNHDAVRAAEPQAAFSEDFAAPLLKLPNVISVSNPAIVNIDASENFPGFDVLLYHGYSFDYYVANVDSIRKQGGYERADLIMRFLLQRRHLAPAHTSTLILPDHSLDPLFIGKVPDIFATGHIHRTSVSDYRGVSLINSSCWQGKTKFQERMGHTPQPSRVPVLNLKTRAIKIINFGK